MQDIYGLDATTIIIRISTDDMNAFNQHNEFSIDQLRKELEDKEIECFFQKIAPEEHKIIVPIRGGQLEVFTKLHSSETYQAVVNKKLKTVFRKKVKLPEKDYYKETVTIRTINVNDRGRATDEFVALFKKVESLPIATTINIENQQEIWFKWIEAQKAIIDNLQRPYKVKGAPQLQETKNEKGEVTRYTLKFDLANEILPEYKQLEAKLKELGVEENFDGEGNIFLTREQIKSLDAVIQREFPDKLERSQTIGVILKIRPLSLAQKIQKEIGIPVSQNPRNKQLFIDCKANEVLNQTLRNKGFEFKHYRDEFRIINHGNIIENDSLNNKYSITFGNRFVKPDNEKELLLPYPENNTFIYSVVV